MSSTSPFAIYACIFASDVDWMRKMEISPDLILLSRVPHEPVHDQLVLHDRLNEASNRGIAAMESHP